MITINLPTVANKIADLSYDNNVRSFGLSKLPEDIESHCPLFCPRPDNFIERMTFTRVSFGGTTGAMNLEYDMTWTYYHAPFADNIDWFSHYSSMITSLTGIIKTILSDDTISEAVDLTVRDIARIGILRDTVGKEYHGVEIVLHVVEFIQ